MTPASEAPARQFKTMQAMLRFDLPRVPAQVIRLEAFLTCVISLLALALQQPWLMLLLVLLGFVRGFFGHHREPLHRWLRAMAESRGWGGKLEDVGAKMFAAKVLFLAAAVSLGLALAGSPLWQVPAGVLVLFSFLEWAFAFCAGCWAYGVWYRVFPPKA